jgi:hypothetical protein
MLQLIIMKKKKQTKKDPGIKRITEVQKFQDPDDSLAKTIRKFNDCAQMLKILNTIMLLNRSDPTEMILGRKKLLLEFIQNFYTDKDLKSLN